MGKGEKRGISIGRINSIRAAKNCVGVTSAGIAQQLLPAPPWASKNIPIGRGRGRIYMGYYADWLTLCPCLFANIRNCSVCTRSRSAFSSSRFSTGDDLILMQGLIEWKCKRVLLYRGDTMIRTGGSNQFLIFRRILNAWLLQKIFLFFNCPFFVTFCRVKVFNNTYY